MITHLHPLSYPQQPTLWVWLCSTPFWTTCTAEEDRVDLLALLQDFLGHGIFVLVEGTATAEIKVSFEFSSSRLFDDVQNFEGLCYHFWTDADRESVQSKENHFCIQPLTDRREAPRSCLL